jgi:ubiquitin C-terminal hydrolase
VLRPRGVINLANSCFLGALIFALASAKPDQLLHCFNNIPRDVQQDRMIIQQMHLLSALTASLNAMMTTAPNITPHNPRSLLNAMPQPFRIGQHDASEALIALLKALPLLLQLNYRDCDQLVHPAMFQQRTIITCANCQVSRPLRQHPNGDWHHQLPCPYKDTSSVQDAINKFLSLEPLNEYRYVCHCRRGQSPSRFNQQMVLTDLPQMLIIQLKRFEVIRGAILKEDTPIRINELLDIPVSPIAAQFYPQATLMNRNYRLSAVVLHTGTPVNGHYTAVGHWPNCNDTWFSCDDKVVMPQQQFSTADDNIQKNAYLLFYNRVQSD